MFSFQTCLQSGGKKCVQLLNTLFTVYLYVILTSNLGIDNITSYYQTIEFHRRADAAAFPGGAKGARAPSGSEAKTVKSACFWLISV